MKTLDTNSDGKVDAAEIEARIETWLQSSAGVSQVLCYVTIDKQPLAGATVTFEPEPFLADDIESAVATTNSYGVASPSIPPEQRKQKDMPYGLRLGFYKVRVSLEKNGKQLIPARYNTETILGQQVAGDDPAILSHRIPLDLKSR